MNNQEFEEWAVSVGYDVSIDPVAPCCVYQCERTDAAWGGYQQACESRGERFSLYHGVWRDSKTGQNMYTEDQFRAAVDKLTLENHRLSKMFSLAYQLAAPVLDAGGKLPII